MTAYYKVLYEDGRVYHHASSFTWPLPVQAADGTWTPGDWREVALPVERALAVDDLCTGRVLHGVRAEQLLDWLGPAIFEMEFDGPVVEGPDKVGGTRARLLRRIETWNERTARIFACDCAEGALQYAAPGDRPTLECAIYVARCYADGEATGEELAAAGDAARAAWAAAGAADWDAAWAAARAAARDAAWAAAWAAAAWTPAWDAARDAARAAARDRLIALLAIDR